MKQNRNKKALKKFVHSEEVRSFMADRQRKTRANRKLREQKVDAGVQPTPTSDIECFVDGEDQHE